MFTLPLYDDNPTSRRAILTWLLISLNVLAYLWQQSLSPAAEEAIVYSLGVIPSVLFGQTALPPELAILPPWASIFSSMFLHGSWLHLGGNMLYLWIFGDNVEDSMGHGRFLVFYLACGAVAALAQSLADPEGILPMIGASGAIAGVLGAYIILHPHANVRVFFFIILFFRLIWVPASLVLGVWFVMQIVSGAMSAGEGGVAFWAHAGGFVAGMGLVPLFKRREMPLFGAKRTVAFSQAPRPATRGGSVPTVLRRPPPDRRGWPYE